MIMERIHYINALCHRERKKWKWKWKWKTRYTTDGRMTDDYMETINIVLYAMDPYINH